MPDPRDAPSEADEAATAHDVEVDAEFTLDLAEAAAAEALEP
jgi:hypothetical protein